MVKGGDSYATRRLYSRRGVRTLPEPLPRQHVEAQPLVLRDAVFDAHEDARALERGLRRDRRAAVPLLRQAQRPAAPPQRARPARLVSARVHRGAWRPGAAGVATGGQGCETGRFRGRRRPVGRARESRPSAYLSRRRLGSLGPSSAGGTATALGDRRSPPPPPLRHHPPRVTGCAFRARFARRHASRAAVTAT